MELADYLRIIRRRWWLVALGMLVCIGGAAAATYTQTAKYTASTRLLVSGASGVSTVDEIANRELANQRAVAFSQIANTGPAISAAEKAAGYSALSTSAVASGTSPFIRITVTATSGRAAAAVANAFVQTLPGVIHRLEQVQSASPTELSTLEAAGVPSSPSSPKPVRNMGIGLVIGIVLGLAAALVRETLDPSFRGSADIERATRATVLGVVPAEFPNEQLIAVTRPRSRRAEAYRQVRTNLEFTRAEGAPASVVVTSAGPGEGKTTVAVNLAMIASHAGKNVVLVDADLRKPVIARILDVPDRPGLSDVLSGEVTLDSALQSLDEERLTLLPSGTLPRSPSEFLGSTVMAELLVQLEDRFDLVIIDTPPVLPVTDALLVGVNAGGVVLVTRLAQTPRSAVRRSMSAITKVNATLLGIVANAAKEPEDRRYGYGYGYLSEHRDDTQDFRPARHIKAAGRRQSRDRAQSHEPAHALRSVDADDDQDDSDGYSVGRLN